MKLLQWDCVYIQQKVEPHTQNFEKWIRNDIQNHE